MNAYDMGAQDMERYGLQIEDMPDILARFDAFQRGGSTDEEEWEEEELEIQIKKDEERIERIREETMESWLFQSTHLSDEYRDAFLGNACCRYDKKDKEPER